MPELSREFLAKLVEGPVRRSAIVQAMGTKESVSVTLVGYARKMIPPCVVERHVSTGELAYSLRPVQPGETAGQVKEAPKPLRPDRS